MKFQSGTVYHIYNQGNNRQRLFHTPSNYHYFIKQYKRFVNIRADLLGYCLMPNHFHFLILTNPLSVKLRKIGTLDLSELSNGIRLMLSAYAAGLNKQLGYTGSQFRQHTKAKLVPSEDLEYLTNCFHYIHQNPVRAGLTKTEVDWEFSSSREFSGERDEGICNLELSRLMTGINERAYREKTLKLVTDEMIKEFIIPHGGKVINEAADKTGVSDTGKNTQKSIEGRMEET